MKIVINNKSFGDKLLYENVDISLSSGLYFLKGDNGVGKSTFLNILYKADIDFDGNVFVNKKDIRDIDTSFYRTNICTYITQENYLFDKLSVKDNISLLVKDINYDVLNEVMDILDFRKVYERNSLFKSLSGGEKQKLKIIIGILLDTPIILIDEIENNLDKLSVLGIFDYLKTMDKLIIMSSHNNGEDNVILVKDKSITCNFSSSDSEFDVLDSVKKLDNRDFKLLSKSNRFSRFSIALIIFFLFLSVSFIGIYFKYLDALIDSKNDAKFNDNVSLVYAPIFNSYYQMMGDKSWLDKIPAYFTKDNKDFLTNMDGVNKVIPIGDHNSSVGSSIREDGYILEDGFDFSNLDYKRYGVEKYQGSLNSSNEARLDPSVLLDPNEVNDNIPVQVVRTSGVGIEEILYGTLPKKDNEIMLPLDYAVYLASEKNLDSLDDLVDKEIVLNGKKDKDNTFYEDNSNELVKFKYNISGIYISYNGKGYSSIVYPYNKDNIDVIDNNLALNHPDIYFGDITYDQVAYDELFASYPSDLEYIPMDDFEKMYPDSKYYSGFYVEADSAKDIENLSKTISAYDPHIELMNNYMIEHGKNYLMFKNKIRNVCILIGIVFVLFVIAIIFLLRYYNLSLKFNRENLAFYSYSKDDVATYVKFERNKLFKIILFIVIFFVILALIIKSLISIVLYTFLLFIVFVLLRLFIKRS